MPAGIRRARKLPQGIIGYRPKTGSAWARDLDERAQAKAATRGSAR